MDSITQKFMTLFKGLERAYVRVPIKKTEVVAGQKVESSAFTVHEQVTEEIWDWHIEGKQNLSIIPIMDTSKVNFGAIDIDNYSLDFKELDEKVRHLGLPLVVCRSKSGGAHLYLFLEHAMSAKFVVSKLRMFATVIGHSFEIFPKQIKLASKNDTGNGISMPYFGGEKTDRFAYYDGKRLTVDEFIRRARKCIISKDDLDAFEIETEGMFKEAPPCLQLLSQSGLPAGYRNDGMFSFGVFCRRRYGDEWKDKFEEINQRVCKPALQATEILGIQKGLSRANKEYFYTCKRAPLIAHCNKEVCRKLEYGIGNHDEIPVTVEALVKIATEPPLYIIQIDGQRIELTTSQLLDFGAFRRRIFEVLNILMPMIKATQWHIEVARLTENIEIRLAPVESTPVGKLIEHLEAYCTGHESSDNREVLVRGGVWIEEESSFTYFRQPRFEEYLQKRKFTEVASNKIVAALRERVGAKSRQYTILGKCISCWRIPSFTEQNQGFIVPETKEGM